MALTARTLCRGTVPVCRRFARSANLDFSPFNVYIQVRSNVNNGSGCAPLNFVMESTAFQLVNDWHFQSGLPVILRGIIVHRIEQTVGIQNECALKIVISWISVADHGLRSRLDRCSVRVSKNCRSLIHTML